MINVFPDVAERRRDCMYCPEPIHKGNACLKIVTQNYKGGSAHGACFQRFATSQNELLQRFVANQTTRQAAIQECAVCGIAVDSSEPHADFCPNHQEQVDEARIDIERSATAYEEGRLVA